MLSRAVVVTMIGSFSTFAAFARPTTLCSSRRPHHRGQRKAADGE